MDAPAWITGTVAYAMNAPGVISTTATLTASVDTTDWSAGRHTVFVEAQDSDGNWGVPTAVFVDVLATHAVALGGVTTQLGAPGETITYTLALTNTGVMTDSFTVFHTLPPELTWDVAVTPEELRDVPPGGIAVFAVAVTIPADATPGQTVDVDLRVVSMEDVAAAADLTVTTRVRGFDQYFPFIAREGPPK